MMTKAQIARTGNSRGIRVPKVLLDQSQLPEPGRLIAQGSRRSRMGWAELAKAMTKRGHDDLLEEPTATRFERQEWEWK